jgi:hypothetical protein
MADAASNDTLRLVRTKRLYLRAGKGGQFTALKQN